LQKIYKHRINQLKNHKYTNRVLDWSKSYKMPGSDGVPLFDIGKFIYEETKKDNITTRANSIAFSLFIAIFPSIIFLFTLLPYLPFTEDYTAAIGKSTESLMPKNAHSYVMSIIHDITKIKRGGLLSLGFGLALYFSSNGILSLMKGFDKSYKESFSNRSIIYKRVIALLLTILLGIIFIFSIVLLIVGRSVFIEVGDMVHNDKVTSILFDFIRLVTALGISYLGLNMLYHFGPSLRKKLPFFNPGCLVASVLSLLTSVLFAYFINNFGQFNEVYGSIGALIVVLLWLKINAFILLVGFELNAAIAVNRDIRNKRQ
jgi:membrane protein